MINPDLVQPAQSLGRHNKNSLGSKKTRMQFGSLRQLTLLSFLIALIPLAALLWQSQSTLSKMSIIAANEADYAVDLTRKMSDAERLSVNIERYARQYNVLHNEEIRSLLTTYLQRFNLILSSLCSALNASDSCTAVKAQIGWLNSHEEVIDELLLNAQLAELRESVDGLSREVQAHLDARVQEHRIYVDKVQQQEAWSTAILVSASFALILFASRIILAPIEKIERIISTVGSESETLPPISHRGPHELIEVEKQLHKLSDRLTQLENLRQALLRHASHELKTPLASMKEGCSLLSEEVVGKLNPAQSEVVNLLNGATERLTLLTEQLLDYNALLQQAKPNFEKLDVETLFCAFLDENALAIKQHNHEIALKLEEQTIVSDPNLFRRILDNLLSNAIAHGAIGRPITIWLRNEADTLVLDVANVGQKIAMEQRKSLFTPFKRGEGRRHDRVIGSGLGLSIVADCARLMGGRAAIVDVDYADVCVRVTLPIVGE